MLNGYIDFRIILYTYAFDYVKIRKTEVCHKNINIKDLAIKKVN